MLRKFFCVFGLCTIIALTVCVGAVDQPHTRINDRVLKKGIDDLDIDADFNRDGLSGAASYGYGYYGYPFVGIYSGSPYFSSIRGYYGGSYPYYYPYLGAYGGYHGHYF